jgi:hypothetical protein
VLSITGGLSDRTDAGGGSKVMGTGIMVMSAGALLGATRASRFAIEKVARHDFADTVYVGRSRGRVWMRYDAVP